MQVLVEKSLGSGEKMRAREIRGVPETDVILPAD